MISSLVVYGALVLLYFASGGWRALSAVSPKGAPAVNVPKAIAAAERPQRILSLAPSITEILYALGLSDRIVGVTKNCNYPPECAKKARVGDIYLDYEQVIKLKPDLIVSEDTVRQEAANKLKGLGFRVLSVRCRTLEDFKASLAIIGQATQTEEESRRILAAMEKTIASVQSKVKSVTVARRPRVFVEIWNEPLMTAGKGTIVSELVELAGGVNIGNDLGGGFPRLSQETLVSRNPDIIVLTTSAREDMLKRKPLSEVKAVKDGRVYKIDPDILVRPSPRLTQGLVQLARWFYSGISF